MITAFYAGRTLQALAAHRGAMGELLDLIVGIARRPHALSDGSRERRIAELLELLDLDAAARDWWHEAASLGDLDAIDYLDILDEEQDGGTTGTPAALPEVPGQPSSELKRQLSLLLAGRTLLGSCVNPVDPRHADADIRRYGSERPHLRCRDPLPLTVHHLPDCSGQGSPCQGDAAVHKVQPFRAAADHLVREIEAHLASPESLAGGHPGPWELLN